MSASGLLLIVELGVACIDSSKQGEETDPKCVQKEKKEESAKRRKTLCIVGMQ